MRPIKTFKHLAIAGLLGVAAAAHGQTAHPLAFPFTIGTTVTDNWYKDYVGIRFTVNSPAGLSGEKAYSQATGTDWTIISYASLPLIDVPIVMGPAGDTNACAPLPAGSMTGKIALIWRGTCEFGAKAAAAEAAGAVACVIVNNVPGGLPVGMGAGASGSSVTIPVFMISNADGVALSGAYAGGTGTAPKMTITQWGQGLAHDLGFVPQAIAQWHNYATPATQFTGSLSGVVPYTGLDGAFVANYGTANASGVSLSSRVQYTPASGSATTIHTGTMTPLLSFPATDSIYAMYIAPYTLSGITGAGKVNVKYSISSDDADDFASDDSISYNFYISDSVYSKGHYDFVNNRPMASIYRAAGLATGDVNYIWGNMYYVKNGGESAKNIQWTMSSNVDTGATITTISSMNVYLFKWVDGSGSSTVADTFLQNGELELVGLGVKDFLLSPLASDTSGGTFTVAMLDSNGTGTFPTLQSNTWYYAAPEMQVPSSTSTWFLGCDGNSSTYGRTYGFAKFNNILEYGHTVWPSGRYAGTNPQTGNPLSTLAPYPYSGTLSFNTDSAIYNTQKGEIPAVALLTKNSVVIPPIDNTGLTTTTQAFAQFGLYPNPAVNYVTVELGLDKAAKDVSYTVLDASAHVVSKEVRHNVLNEKYNFGTSKLASGNYFMVVTADGKSMFKKFTVIK